MLHHLQVWRTHLSGSGWEHTFQPTILSTFISPLSPSFLLTFPHHLPPAPTPFPPPSSLSGRAQRRGDNVKYRNKLWSLIGVAVKKFWCPKKNRKRKRKEKTSNDWDWQSQADFKAGFPTWSPELNCAVKPKNVHFYPLFSLLPVVLSCNWAGPSCNLSQSMTPRGYFTVVM